MGWEDPLEKETATHSTILAWKIPWTEEPGRLQFMGSQRVRQRATKHAHTHTERDTHTLGEGDTHTGRGRHTLTQTDTHAMIDTHIERETHTHTLRDPNAH